jgi:hypothetical protein
LGFREWFTFPLKINHGSTELGSAEASAEPLTVEAADVGGAESP